jgi:hypothetical protein
MSAPTIADGIPVAEITREARQVQVSRVLLVLFLGIFWGIGWLAGRVCLGVVFSAVAVRRGYRDGFGYQPPLPQPGQPSR